MGISRTPEQLVGKIQAYAVGMEKANAEAVEELAAATKRTVLPLMAAATGGDLELSGLGKGKARTKRKVRGASRKVGVRYDRASSSTPGNPAMVVRATGPAHLVEWDVKPHAIVPKGSKGVAAQRLRYRKDGTIAPGRTRSTRKAAILAVTSGDTSGVRGVLKWPGEGGKPVYRRYVLKHPGSKGRHPFEKGVGIVETQAGRIFTRKHRQALARSFGGTLL